MPTLLVIDDEESVRYSFRYVFGEDDVQVLTAGGCGATQARVVFATFTATESDENRPVWVTPSVSGDSAETEKAPGKPHGASGTV